VAGACQAIPWPSYWLEERDENARLDAKLREKSGGRNQNENKRGLCSQAMQFLPAEFWPVVSVCN
jgi:hypothetical protein